MTAKELASEGLRRKIQFSPKKEDVDAALTAFLKEKARVHKAPGFRAGKVPFEMVRKQFLPEALDYAINTLVKKETDAFLKDKKETPLQRPVYNLTSKPTVEAPEKALVFDITYECIPQLPAVSYDALSLTKVIADIQEGDIKELVDEWVKQNVKVVPLTEQRASQQGDVLVVNVEVSPPQAEPHKMDALSFFLDEKELGPDLFKSLLNVKKGDVVSRKTFIPKDHSDKAVAGKKLPTTYEIVDIKKRVPLEGAKDLPELLGLKNEEDVKSKAKDILGQKAKELEFLWLKRQVLDYFASQYDFDLPQSLVDAEFNKLWEEASRDIEGALLSKANTKEAAKPSAAGREAAFKEAFDKTEEDTKAFLKEVAERRVKLGFVLSEMGKKLSVSISDDEMRDLLIAEMHRYKGQEKQVAAFYQRSPEALAALKAPLFEKKVVEALLQQKPPVHEKKLSLKEIEERLEDQKLFEKVA